MPSLDKEDIERMRDSSRKCPVCGHESNKGYCNSCDEFFFYCSSGCRCNDTAHDDCHRKTL